MTQRIPAGRIPAGRIFAGIALAAVAVLAVTDAQHPAAPARRAPALTVPRTATQFNGPLRKSTVNPRYFTDASGKAVYLTGSQTWADFQDGSIGDPPAVFDYRKYLDFLQANNHNFTIAYVWEESRWITTNASNNYWFNPGPPFKRTGPGNALDGKPKWNLDSLDQGYFDRLRARCDSAGARGIYVSIMLFNGWSISYPKFGNALQNPWRGHPFNAANNVNGVNGDPGGLNSGDSVHTLDIPAVTACQLRYVKKVIDAVNDLDNVLFEISNESEAPSIAWQYMMIDTIHAYEKRKPKQHPVGMVSTVPWGIGNYDDALHSNADYLDPNDAYNIRTDPVDPVTLNVTKVHLSDTDHIFGIGGDHVWVWKVFMRGHNPVFMDGYDSLGTQQDNTWDPHNPEWPLLRASMGYTRAYASRLNLARTSPRGDLTSTGYCLASDDPTHPAYLVYRPATSGSFTVDLSAAAGTMSVEWFRPTTGATQTGAAVTAGAVRSFTPPFSDDAVLFLTPAVTGLGDAPAPPAEIRLHQNWPNPFNPSTTILYDLPRSARVRITIRTITGQEIRTLVDRPEAAGSHTVVWDGTDARGRRVSSGVYFCTMSAGSFAATLKMLVLG